MEKIKWTEKNTLAGKTLPVIVLALVLNTFLFRLGDSLLYALIPGDAAYIVAMWVYAVVSLATSLLLSVKLLQFLCNKKLERMDAWEAEAHLRRESKFKWHVLFTIGIGLLTLTAAFMVAASVLAATGDVPAPEAVIGVALAVILVTVLVIIGGKKLNWHMVQVTATNAELIAEVYCGLHDAKIPNGITRSEVIGVLYHAAAYSVTTAVVIHVVTAVLKKVGKTVLKVLGISALIGLILGLIGADAMDRWADERVQRIKASMDAAASDNKAHAAWMDATEEAKKKAQFSYRQAAKAYNYNPDSYDAYRKKNLFMKDYWNYQDIKKGK